MTTLLVIAKAPRAGVSKTRLCPPCTPEQAARVAEAALVDTLDAVARTSVDRRVLVLDGVPGAWLPAGFEVVAQHGADFGARLGNAFRDSMDGTREPTLLIGMDTPQVTARLLEESLTALLERDSVLGHASDGGWWAIGLHGAPRGVFTGIPMSTDATGRLQERRLRTLGRVGLLPVLRDVDTWADACAVADGMEPHSRFAAAIADLRDAGAQP